MQKDILIIDDDRDTCMLLKSLLEKNNYNTTTVNNGREAISYLKKSKADLALCDYRLPDVLGLDLLEQFRDLAPEMDVIIITGYADVRVAVKALRLGAFDYITKPIYPDEILLTIDAAFTNKKEQRKKATGKKKVVLEHYITGVSAQSKQVEKHIDLIAPTDMTVIIEGETGTGKEYVARAVHQRSKRKNKLFLTLDCGAISNELAASELFGHKKGSFTGAVTDKVGSFEKANGGTLFLDEVGNLSYENQVKLLRVLQERKISKIGDNTEIEIDVRIIAATNDNLKYKVAENKFREDIYHRLNEFKIEITPLRERKEDILYFANHFLKLAINTLEKPIESFDKETLTALKEYWWYGNLRELRNVIRRAVLLCQTKQIGLQNLPPEILNGESEEPESVNTSNERSGKDDLSLKSATKLAEKKIIEQALTKAKNNKSKAAEILSIDRKTLYNKLNEYNIDY